jgi:hypothetical protein
MLLSGSRQIVVFVRFAIETHGSAQHNTTRVERLGGEDMY